MTPLPLPAAIAIALLLAGCGKSGGETGGNASAPAAPAPAAAVLPAEARPVTRPPIDLDGVWQAVGTGALVTTARPPLSPAGVLAYAANKAAKAKGGDPIAQCLPPGVPRIMALPARFAISWNQDMILMHFETQRLDRLIYLTDRYATNDDPSFLGQSRAHWDGKALVIESGRFKDGTWLDAAGLPHSARLAIEERITLDGADAATDRLTITDPGMYDKPWTAEIRLRRIPNGTIAEDVCVERQGIHP